MAKSVDESEKYRKLGNEFFTKRQMEAALDAYNNSIIFAPDSSQSSAYAYGNRSALFFELNGYSECLRDIERAEACLSCPPGLKEKLYARREKCLKIIENDLGGHMFKLSLGQCEGKRTIPKFFNGSNPSVPDLSRDIVMEYDTKMGRRLIATKDIEPGSVLIIEKPYASVLVLPSRTTHCHHCHEKLPLDFIPCKDCVDVRFCSEECLSNHKKQHDLECQFVDRLHDAGIGYLAYKVFTASAIKDLAEYFFCRHCQSDQTKLSEGTYGLKPGEIYDGSSYRCLWNLMAHHEEVPEADLSAYDQAAKLLTRLAKSRRQWPLIVSELFQAASGVCDECKSAPDARKSEMASDYLQSVFIRLIEIVICNAHAITAMARDFESDLRGSEVVIERQSETRMASAIYLTASLMNHACQPNIFSSFIGKTLIVRALRPIKAGEEILNCYGPQFGRQPVWERKAALKQQYYFDCVCCACTEVKYLEKESDLYAMAVVCPKCPETFNVVPLCFITGPCSHKVRANTMKENSAPEEFWCEKCGFRMPIKPVSDQIQTIEDKLEPLLQEKSEQEQRPESVSEETVLQLLDNLSDLLFPHNKSLSAWRDRVAEWLLKNGTKTGMAQSIKLVEINLDSVGYIYGYGIEWANEVSKFLELASIALSKKLDGVSVAPDGRLQLRRLSEKAKAIFALHYGENCIQIKEMNKIDTALFELL